MRTQLSALIGAIEGKIAVRRRIEVETVKTSGWREDYEAVTRLMREHRIGYLRLRQGGRTIEMSMAMAAAAPRQTASVSSPSDGTFLCQHPCQSAPFVEEGAQVKAGDMLALLGQGPLFSVIRAPRGGIVSRILARHGEAVTVGAPLLHLA
ncbi:MAG: hypothetical protein KIS86_02870 [Devosia sp.]|nr:hypothetical protein [Devosia sp.]